MTIILVAQPSSFTNQLRKAFTKNGAEIIFVDVGEIMFLPILRNNVFLWRLLKKIRPLKKANNKFFAKHLIDLCHKKKPEALFIDKGMTIKPETLKEIKGMGIKTINWFLDNIQDNVYKNWFLNNHLYYDYFFCFDSSVLEYEGNNFYIPMGADPDMFSTIPSLNQVDYEKYSCDLCFIGGYSKERERYLAKIKDLNLKIFGWKKWEESPLAGLYKGPLNLEESIKAYNCAKICINLNSYPPVNGVNLKTFEISFSGGFQLSDYRKDIEKLFVIGKEVEIFHNEDELREKAIFYLKNQKLAKGIAKAGRIRAFRDHTFEKRVAEMLEIIER